MASQGRKGRVVRGVAALGLACAAIGSSAAAGPQVRFTIPQPFEVGSRHYTSGTIAVRTVGSEALEASLVEVWVDGSYVGALAARRSPADAPAARDEAFFRRGDQGQLVMTGYRVAGTSAGTTYRFDERADLSRDGSTLAATRRPTSRR